MQKYSRQREAVKNCLMMRRDHPTAEMLYRDLRVEYPKLSLGTVYRNLALLESLGEIQRITCGDGMEHYDANVMEHYHLICRECGGVSDVPMKGYVNPWQFVGSDFSGRIDGYSLVLRGTCESCAAGRTSSGPSAGQGADPEERQTKQPAD